MVVVGRASVVGAYSGLPFPATQGVYQIQIATDGGARDSLYVEVFGTDFTTCTLRSYVAIQGEWNALDLTLKPATQIATTDFLVVELPTGSLDELDLFEDFSGVLSSDYQLVTYDLISSTIASFTMTCRFYRGRQAASVPVRVVCGSFSAAITTSATIRFVFAIQTPTADLTKNLFVPVRVYSVRAADATKSNYRLLKNGIYLQQSAVTPAAMSTDFSAAFTPNTVKSLANFDLELNVQSALLASQSAVVVRLGFAYASYPYGATAATTPVSQVFAGGFSDGTNTGDVIFCANLAVYILLPAVDIAAAASVTVSILNTAWYNPLYQLNSTAQQTLVVYTTTNLFRLSGKLNYTNLLPTFAPFQSGTTNLVLAMLPFFTLQGQFSTYDYISVTVIR